MPLIMSLVLGSVGLVLIKSAFTTPPDPREVLRALFSGQNILGGAVPTGGSFGPSPTGSGAGNEVANNLQRPANRPQIGTPNPNVE